MNVKKTILSFSLLGFLFISCNNDDTREVLVEVPAVNFGGKIMISSEGNFGANDGSISIFSNNLTDNKLFAYEKENGVELGGLIQSVSFHGDDTYIVLNDVNSIVVVDSKTLKKKDIITTGLQNPRYMTIVGNKGYVTNWGDGANTTDDYVAVINLETNKVISEEKISLENGVEQILNKNNKLYVSHKGAFGSNNIISVVDLGNENEVTKITVKDKPDEMLFSDSGDLIVLSEGKPTEFGGAPLFEVLKRTQAGILTIDTDTNKIVKELLFDENKGSSLLAYENGMLYYVLDNVVYSVLETENKINKTEGIAVENLFGMNVKEGQIYTLKFAFTTLSELEVYNVDSKEKQYGSAVGLGASKIYFIE